MRFTRPAACGWVAVLVLSASTLSAAGEAKIADAVKAQEREAVRDLIKAHVDVNAAQGDGTTALHWAAHWNDLETAKLLIAAGANVNARTALEVTPLAVACLNGNVALVEALLASKADPNIVVVPSGATPLMIAARAGSADAVRALLVHGANVNAKEAARGQTALMWAASQRHPEVVRLLIEAGADVTARTLSYPQVENFGGQVRGNVQGVPVADDAPALDAYKKGGSTPLLFAARVGDLESARLLADAGASVNDSSPDGMNGVVLASRSGHPEVAEFLLDRGADANAADAGYTALHSAVLMSQPELVKALLAHGANPNTPLTRGTPVRRGGEDLVLPNTFVGATPFLLAAKFADVPILKSLAAAGGDPRIPMKSGITPLTAAAGAGWSGGTTRRGIDLFANFGTAVDPKAEEETIDALRVLLDMGVDVNSTDSEGSTALFGAVSRGMDSVVQFLAGRGADVNVVNKRGQTALKLTVPGRNGVGLQSTADVLRKLGARDQPTVAKIVVKSDADYAVAMKEIGIQATALRRATSDETEAANSARQLEAIFGEIAQFWSEGRAEDAAAQAKDAVSAARAVIDAVAAHDMNLAGRGVTKLNNTCTTCHNAHRDRLPDGTFKLK